jgi:hypothetical protein
MLHCNASMASGADLGMGWVQHHRRHGAMLALIALALQIAFAFGHVHLRGSAQYSHAAITHAAALAQTKSHAPAQIPDDDDRYCPICASIFLASTAFAPAPPQLPLPAKFERVEHLFANAAAIAGRQRLAFRSRAPPVA